MLLLQEVESQRATPKIFSFSRESKVRLQWKLNQTKMSKPSGSDGWQVSQVCKQGKHEDALVLFEKHPDVFGASALIGAFSKTSLEMCFSVYQSLLSSGHEPDLFVFTALLSACCSYVCDNKAMVVWKEMCKYGVKPDKRCFGLLATACSKAGDSEVAAHLFALLQPPAMFAVNELDCTQLIQTFAESGKICEAVGVLDYMIQHNIKPNAVTFACLFKGCATAKDLEAGQSLHQLFSSLQIQAPARLFVSLIYMYGK